MKKEEIRYRLGDRVRYTEEAQAELGGLPAVDDRLHVVVERVREQIRDDWTGEQHTYQYLTFEDGDGCDAEWVELVRRAPLLERLLRALRLA